jgi:hypothetical protein
VYLFVEFSDLLFEERWESFEGERFGERHDLPRSSSHNNGQNDLKCLQGFKLIKQGLGKGDI